MSRRSSTLELWVALLAASLCGCDAGRAESTGRATGAAETAAPAAAPQSTLPAVFYADVNSGPGSGGEDDAGAYVTLHGTGFGEVQGTVTIGGGKVHAYRVWSPTLISVQIGRAARSGAIVVRTAEGREAQAAQPFTVRAGHIWFVAPTGDDRSCRAGDVRRPCRTPNSLVREGRVAPGDFIVVRGGTYGDDDPQNGLYSNTWIRPTVSGSAGAPIAVIAYPGEAAVFEQRQGARLFSHYDSIAHWVISGFRVRIRHCRPAGVMGVGDPATTEGCRNPGAVRRATDVSFVGIDIDGGGVGGMCGGSGGDLVEIGAAERIRVLGLTIHDTSPQNPDEPTHAIYLAATQKDVEVGWNRIWNIPHSRALIQVHQDSFNGACWARPTMDRIAIHDNELRRVAGQAILVDGGAGQVEIYNNVISDTPLADDHRYPDVISLRGSGGQLEATLAHNTVVADPGAGERGYLLGIGAPGCTGTPKSVQLFNNVFQVTGGGRDAYIGYNETCAEDTPISGARNLWFGAGRPPAADVSPLSTNPRLERLRPQAGSPLIGAGRPTPYVLDHDGHRRTTFDVGAYSGPP